MKANTKLLRSLIVLVLWAPVPFLAALPDLAPAWLGATLIGVPLSIWMVVVLTIILVALSWFFSAEDDAEQRARA